MRAIAVVVSAGAALTGFTAGAFGQHVPEAYTLIELQRIDPGNPVYPVAINNSGVAVGESVDGSVRVPVVFMPDGVSSELSTPVVSDSVRAIDINDEGAILYGASVNQGSPLRVRTAKGVHHELPVPAGYDLSYGVAINSRGDVAGGMFELPDLFDGVPAIWSLTPSGYEVNLISSLFRVGVGAFSDSGLIGHWGQNSGTGNGDLYDTRTGEVVFHFSGGQFADAQDINNAGRCVYVFDEGASDVQTGVSGVVGSIFPLGCEGSATPWCETQGQMVGRAINEQDVVVGYANPVLLDNDGWPDGDYGPSTAFIWSEETSSVRLADLVLESDLVGWSLAEAVDINDAGWIVGKGTKDGEAAAFLLIPREPCIADTNRDGDVTPADFSAWVSAFNRGCD